MKSVKSLLAVLVFLALAMVSAHAEYSGPTTGGGSSGVSSINSTAGAFTFSGSGVSCSGTTCTFSGGGGGGTPGGSNLQYQQNQGGSFAGVNPYQIQGTPSHSVTSLDIVTDASGYNSQFLPISYGYGGQLAKTLGVGPTYYVLNDFGHFDCDIINSEVVPNINPVNTNNPTVAWLSSPNDPTFGAGSYSAHLTDSNSCRMGGLTWAAVPQSYKVYAQSSSFTTTGTWTNSTAYGGTSGIVSTTNASTATGTITSNGGAIYLWYQMHGADGGTFTYQLDSGATTTVATQGQNAFTYPISTSNYTLGAVRIPASLGSHTVTVAVTSSTSASNSVTILGLGTAPGTAYAAGAPPVYISNELPDATYPAAVTAFNAAILSQVSALSIDGLNVNLANLTPYVVLATDYTNFNGTSHFNSTGQGHIADAFAGVIQGNRTGKSYEHPIDFGASCNAQMFSDNFNGSGNHAVSMTSGSAVISIQGYTFQPGVATATGGGDVGKVISVGGGNSTAIGSGWGAGFYQEDQGPTTYIASVNVSNNTATLGHNMSYTTVHGWALFGGYPTNPANPATAADDTNYIQNASNAAALGGGVVALPQNCLVHNLVMANNTKLEGSNGGIDYNEFSGYPNFTQTPLYVSSTGFADDIDTVTGKARSVGIDTTQSSQVELKDFTAVCLGEPDYNYVPGLYVAAVGEQANAATDIGPDHVKLNHLTITGCAVSFNEPLGNNQPVTFTASISGTTMTVSAITSTNFAGYMNGTGAPDYLSVGRPFTGAGVTAGTVITSAPVMGGTGTYTVNNSQTISSETMTSTPATAYTSGTMQETEMAQDGMGLNGDLSDFTWNNNISTVYNIGWYLGPSSGTAGSSGARANGGRFESGGGLILDGTYDDIFTGVQFQATNCAVETRNGWGHIEFAGDWFQGNDCDAATSVYAQVKIGGSGTNIDFSGISGDFNNYGGGGYTASKYFVEFASGSTADYVTFNGGDLHQSFNTAFSTGTYPTHYQQLTSGLPKIDTTQSTLSIGTTGLIGMGTATAVNTLDVTGTGIHIASGVPGTTTANLYNNAGTLTWAGTALTGGGGSGTVTTFSCVTANGVSCSVANATTTPAATFTLGAITPTTVDGLTITSSTGTLTIANGKTHAVNNSLTFTGTDSTSFAFPSSSGTVATLGAANAFTGNNTLAGTTIAANAITVTPTTCTVSGSACATNYATSGNTVYVTLPSSATTTISNPTNSQDGGNLTFILTQGTSSVTSWGTNFDFGAAGAPTLSVTSGKVDNVGFKYNANLSKWVYQGSTLGN